MKGKPKKPLRKPGGKFSDLDVRKAILGAKNAGSISLHGRALTKKQAAMLKMAGWRFVPLDLPGPGYWLSPRKKK